MKELSLLSACIFSLFLASCGGSPITGEGRGGSVLIDADGDGIPDLLDQCPFDGFTTDDNTDGCEDSTTDSDNDGVNGVGADGSANDKCPFDGFNTDDNNDGCDDSTIDSDNDGVNGVTNGNANDKCINSTGFVSGTIVNGVNNDVDGDGCEDGTDEDIDLDKDGEKNSADDDDDDDGKVDTNDACPRGTIGTVGLDTDNDGCKDTEDVDDNNNGLIEIATADELKNIRYQLEGSRYKESASDQGSNAGCEDTGSGPACKGYELANDIDLLSANFEPITGNFTAILEGNDNTINNLTINISSRRTGFFTFLATGSTIRNLSFVSGSVASTYVSADGNDSSTVGVLVGVNMGTISDVSTKSLSVTASTGGHGTLGGLAGHNIGIITNSYAIGTANGGNGTDDRVGGLVGQIEGRILDSYAIGSANGGTGNDYVGGLVGYAGNDNFSVTLQNSYSLGNVDGGNGADGVGRLLGKKGTGTKAITITSNYYNSESQLNNGETKLTLNDPEAVAKTRDNLKRLTAPTTETDFTGDNNGWSTNDWNFGTNTQYPSLKSYETTTDTSTPPVITQIAGKLLCGQPTDFVQCTPTP